METEHLLLVNTESQERHRLSSESEFVIGRGWLNCNDKRISRKHGKLRLNSNNSISLTSTHTNPIFYRRKDDGTLQMLHENHAPAELNPGDSFGFLPSTLWFEIIKSNVSHNEAEASPVKSNAANENPEAESSGVKRKLRCPDDGSDCKKSRNDESETTQEIGSDSGMEVAADEGRYQVPSSLGSNEETDFAISTPGSILVPETARNVAELGSAAMDVTTGINSNGLGSVENALVPEPEDDHSMEPNEVVETKKLLEVTSATVQAPIEVIAEQQPESTANVPEAAANIVEAESMDVPTESVDKENPIKVEMIEKSVAPESAASDMTNVVVKIERTETAGASDTAREPELTVPLPNIVIKTEPNADNEQNAPTNEPVPGPSNANDANAEVKKEVKTESNSPDSSTAKKQRDCCPYGIKCYRRNPQHFREMAHPSDSDYQMPSYAHPIAGAPQCPYGNRCYRRNPTHFRQFSHPPSTDPVANRRQLRPTNDARNAQNGLNDDMGDSDSNNDVDPFADDDSMDDADFEFDMESVDTESSNDSGRASNDEPRDENN